MLRLFILSFLVSAVTGFFILRWQNLHRHFSSDHATPGSHKVHTVAVPRIGGIGIFVGWLVALITAGLLGKHLPGRQMVLWSASWVLVVAPVFVAGLTEDITKRIGPGLRLLASFVSAALAYYLFDAGLVRFDIPGVDQLLAVPLVSFLLTLIAVGGVAHAINIIDGLNGLAAAVCLMAFLAFGYVAFQVRDTEILLLTGLGFGALLGFNIWNYPSGQIFCGDGGAYFLGVFLAVLSTLLVGRHPEVSAWFPLLLVLYPVWETLFSAYRRKVIRGHAMMHPDRLHLHTLIYRRVKIGISGRRGGFRSRRNSDAATLMIMLAGSNALPAVVWWDNTPMLVAAALFFILVYLFVYRRLVTFRFAARHR